MARSRSSSPTLPPSAKGAANSTSTSRPGEHITRVSSWSSSTDPGDSCAIVFSRSCTPAASGTCFTPSMPELDDVTTPLGQNRCDTEQEVTDRIAEYMQTERAALNRVSVIRVPETGNTVVAGEEVSPAYFWAPPD